MWWLLLHDILSITFGLLFRLTETARLLKNVFRRPSSHVPAVPLEMELQRKIGSKILVYFMCESNS